jgi:hypothetical protein
VAADEENDRDRYRRVVSALAYQISADLDVLDGELHDALDDPKSFLGKRARK